VLYLEDSGANLWLVGVTDTGLLQTTSLGAGTAGNVYLNDSVGNSWQLGVNAAGLLTTTSVSNAGYHNFITLVSPGGFSYQLLVLISGLLETLGIYSVAGGTSSVMVGRIQRRSRSEFIA
jgi:hypothetical protein